MHFRSRLLLCALAASSVLVAACGGERHATPSTPLAAPATALVNPQLCAAADEQVQASRGTVGLRSQDGRCWRSTSVLEVKTTTIGARKQALAIAPTRPATADELFNWAEVAYPEYFPSRRSNLLLGPYTYRYYPESQNHVAVSDGLIFLQGPISGGGLLYVGSVAEYTCLAMPELCGNAPAACAPVTQWTSTGGNICAPDTGQNNPIAHGASFTFTDNTGPLYGAAPYRCENGTLQPQGTLVCSTQEPAACNTNAISWSVGGNTCTPNATEPTQIASGTSYIFSDSVQTNGQATYSCQNGVLAPQGNPSCNPRPATGNCTPNDVQWEVSGNTCSATTKPVEVADGTAYTFVDSAQGAVGRAVFRCTGFSLQLEGTPTCEPGRVLDSFGGDGGAADGGASGDGTAADGAPLVGASVRVTDLFGRTATATTDSNGYWRVRLTGMVPPLLVRVAHPDGRVRHSVSLQPLRKDGYIFIAVTGLTDKIVSDIARVAQLSGAAAMTPSRLASLGIGVVNTVVTALRSDDRLRAEMVDAGLDPDTFDPLTTPFRPDGKGYDRLLDNLVVDYIDGETVLRSKTCSINEISWTVAGNTCTAGSRSVTIKLQAGSTLTLQDSSGSTRGAATFSCVRGVPEAVDKSCTL
jgi:hypothetical protein